MQTRRIVFGEIGDVVAALEVLVATEARNDRIVLAAQGLRPLDDLLAELEMVRIAVRAALVGQQRQVGVGQGAMTEVERHEVKSRLLGAARSLAEILDQLLIDLGRDDAALHIADDVFVARAPGDRARNPALAGL